MEKVFSIELSKSQTLISCLEFDSKDFDRTDEQIRFRMIYNSEFIPDIYYHYNECSNKFEIESNQDLYLRGDIKQNRFITNVFWLYLLQFRSVKKLKTELNNKDLKYELTMIDDSKLEK